MRSSTGKSRAAIYVRLSYQQWDGQAELTHARQEEACRALANREGWQIVEVYRDVDSAYSTKARPGYEAMTEAAARGEFDILVAWGVDRLYRRVQQLLDITNGLATQVRIETVTSGDVDLTTADGRLRAGMLAQVAEHESAKKGERVAARIKQRATVELRPAAGGRRQYGWMPLDPDPERPGHPRRGSNAGWQVYEPEALFLREAYTRVARGDSIASVARWLNDQGEKGPTGQPFKVATVRSLMKSARQAGLVTFQGQIVGEAADGQRVVDIATWHQVQRILSDPSKDRVVRERTLLAGMATCTRCGGVFSSSTKDDRSRRVPILRCRGCGMSRRKSLVEPLVVAAVGEYLTTHRRRLLLPDRAAAKGQKTAERDLSEIESDIVAMDSLLAAGKIRAEAYAKATSVLYQRRDAALASFVARAGRRATAALVAVDDPVGAWEQMAEHDLVAARAVLREIVKVIEISPSAIASRPNPDDVQIRWSS